MKYVFLAYGDEKQWDAMSSHERDTLENACRANEQDLRQSGHLVAVEGLQSSNTAIMVRIVHGKVSLTDGPLAEKQGQLILLPPDLSIQAELTHTIWEILKNFS